MADAKSLYNASGSDVRKALEQLFGAETFEFNYRDIKSFDDACRHLGISTEIPAKRACVDYCDEAAEQAAATYMLIVICKALCNGKYTDKDGFSWFPWYWLYSKEELAGMSKEELKEKGIQLLSACCANFAGFAGVRCADAINRGAHTYATYGFPLCANSKEMAMYLDEQFRDLIYQCYGIKVKQENE